MSARACFHAIYHSYYGWTVHCVTHFRKTFCHSVFVDFNGILCTCIIVHMPISCSHSHSASHSSVCACVSDANFKDASCHCSNDALISWNWPKYNRNFHSSESVPISLECIAVHCTWAHTHTHSHLDDMCKVCCACFMDAKWMLSKNETTECDAMQCRVWVCRWMNLVSQ